MKHFIFFTFIASISAPLFAAPTPDDYVPVDQYFYSIVTPLSNLTYKTAVHFEIANKHTNTTLRERAARGDGAQVLAKYDVLIDNIAYDQNQSTPAADIQSVSAIDFTVAENTAQGWARMSEAAIPALTIALNGESSGHASASWRTTYQVAGSGVRNVSLKFRIPETVMDGRYEFSGKGPHQGRVKVEALVNGYPVWRSEAVRIAPAIPSSATDYVIDNFGTAWAFDVNAERSNAKWVTAALGTYSAGQALDVTLVYFVEASVGQKCLTANNMFACMGMNVGFKRDNTTTLPSFTSSPIPLAASVLIPSN